jgi:hypothetical protein
MRRLWPYIRLAVAALLLAAVAAQFVESSAGWERDGLTDTATLIVNFFSYFTIESNLASVAILAIGGVLLLRGVEGDPSWFLSARAAVVTYMAITGIVYNLLLRSVEIPPGAEPLPIANEILHVVGPLCLVLDWLFAPGRRPLAWKTLWVILAFPIVWVLYTLIRGTFTDDEREGGHWYPYPFLNPDTSSGGYAEVALYIVGIALLFAAAGAGVIALSRRGSTMSESR